MIRKILIPLDGSGRAEAALSHAVAVADAFGAELYLLRAIESGIGSAVSVVDSMAWRLARVEARGYLDTVLEKLNRTGHQAHAVVVEGRPADQIVRFIAAQGIDLVVLATHGCGAATDFALGGTAGKTLEQAGTSVILVPSRETADRGELVRRYDRILVPVDCSRRSEWAVSLAAIIARAHRAELVLLHVVPIPHTAAVSGAPANRLAGELVAVNQAAAADYLARLEARLQGPDLRVRWRLEVARSLRSALATIIAEEGPDLTVLCAHGSTGDQQQPYGSVARLFLGPKLGVVAVLQDLPRRWNRVVEATPARSAAISAAS